MQGCRGACQHAFPPGDCGTRHRSRPCVVSRNRIRVGPEAASRVAAVGRPSGRFLRPWPDVRRQCPWSRWRARERSPFPCPLSRFATCCRRRKRAPYGKGTETLVDASVRDCWQVDRGADSPGWKRVAGHSVEHSRRGVGGPRLPERAARGAAVQAVDLRDGGLFRRSIATRRSATGWSRRSPITLSAAGAGGELVVRHLGREKHAST